MVEFPEMVERSERRLKGLGEEFGREKVFLKKKNTFKPQFPFYTYHNTLLNDPCVPHLAP